MTSKVQSKSAKREEVVSGRSSVVGILSGALFFLCFVHGSLNIISAQTGGTFDLSHSAIASGGGSNSTGGTFSIEGTIGQPVAGAASGSSPFSLHAGFWFQNLAPTAAGVSVGGRVTTSTGTPISSVRITLLGPDNLRSAITNAFGYYRFDDVAVGETYLLDASSKRFQFITRTVTVVDELTDLDIIALP